MSTKITGPAFTKRSQEIIDYLFINKVATFKQIYRDLFPNVTDTIPSRHLLKLLRGDLIHKESRIIGDDQRFIYRLDPFAKNYLTYSDTDFFTRQELQSGKIGHDLALVDLRSKLAKYPGVKGIYSENEIQCISSFQNDSRFLPFVQLRSDAVLQIERHGKEGFVALEFEYSKKTPERYEQKLKDYYRSTVFCVLFISANNEIQRAVQRIEKRVMATNSPKFFYALLDNVLLTNETPTFIDLENRTFKSGEM